MSARKVLIIDDNQTILEMFETGLEKNGYEPLMAIDGTIGLRLYHEEHPDVVIVDIAMPGVDGYQVIEEIRETDEQEDQHTPVIVLTAHQQTVMRDYAEELGVDLYLTKPIIIKDLVEKIAELVDD